MIDTTFVFKKLFNTLTLFKNESGAERDHGLLYFSYTLLYYFILILIKYYFYNPRRFYLNQLLGKEDGVSSSHYTVQIQSLPMKHKITPQWFLTAFRIKSSFLSVLGSVCCSYLTP